MSTRDLNKAPSRPSSALSKTRPAVSAAQVGPSRPGSRVSAAAPKAAATGRQSVSERKTTASAVAPAKKPAAPSPSPGKAKPEASPTDAVPADDNITDTDSNATEDSESALGATSELQKRNKTKVLVSVRIRPMNQIEQRSKQSEAWVARNDATVVQTWVPQDGKSEAKPLTFNFDHVFTNDKNNAHVYERLCKHVVDNAMAGYHGCVFAYGQTSSGKTYTIHGTKDDPGMIPISVGEVFDHIENTPGREFVLRVSYLEIYNEIINDLLDPLNTNLRVREDKNKGVFCEGLKEDVVMSAEQVFALLQAGESHRHVGRTNYNEVSSRSHTIFRIIIESSPRVGFTDLDHKPQGVRFSILNLVDLAGSENAIKAGSSARINETGYINKSLLTLGHVIYKLTENNPSHIPYRDSKLTRILQGSLDGKACVSVVCNVSPSSGNLEESISTLKFAMRAKKIKASAKANEVFDDSTLLRQYREEIVKLKAELAMAKEQNKMIITKTTENERMEMYQETNALNAQIEQLTRLILTSSTHEEGGDSKRGTHRSTKSVALPYGPGTGSLRGALKRSTLEELKEDGTSVTSPTAPAGGALATLAASASQLGNLNLSSLNLSALSPTDLQAQITSMMQQVTQLSSRLENKEREVDSLRTENDMLRKEIEKQNQTLDEWDRYYVSMKNKHQAIQSRMRDLAPEPEPENDLDPLDEPPASVGAGYASGGGAVALGGTSVAGVDLATVPTADFDEELDDLLKPISEITARVSTGSMSTGAGMNGVKPAAAVTSAALLDDDLLDVGADFNAPLVDYVQPLATTKTASKR